MIFVGHPAEELEEIGAKRRGYIMSDKIEVKETEESKKLKRKKVKKIILIIIGVVFLLLVAAALILLKPLAMSVYNDNFGSVLQLTSRLHGVLKILTDSCGTSIPLHRIKVRC